MTLEEISGKYSHLDIYENRAASDEYCELVFYSKQTDEWNKAIANFFGPPIKPVKVRPTKQDISLTKEFGGVDDNQTLFKKEADGAVAIAMFWPWQDGAHTTLKIALLKKQTLCQGE